MSTSFLKKIRQLASGPQGRRVATEAQRLARDPKTRAKIDEARRRLASRRRKPE